MNEFARSLARTTRSLKSERASERATERMNEFARSLARSHDSLNHE